VVDVPIKAVTASARPRGMVRRSTLHAHVLQRMSPNTCRLPSVALLIALNLLRTNPATGP
jgi:hypothetical protein